MKTPITKTSLREHWRYSWWKYVLLVVLTLMGWNILYSVTAYRPPQDKVVDLYIYGYTLDDSSLQAWLDEVRANEMDDMEQMDVVVVTPDETYGAMILSTRFAANEGEIYILPKTYFQNYASQGWFVALEDMEGLIDTLTGADVDLERSWRMNTDINERHLYGIPLSALPGLSAQMVCDEEAWVCLSVNGGNEENARKLLELLVRDWITAPDESQTTPSA